MRCQPVGCSAPRMVYNVSCDLLSLGRETSAILFRKRLGAYVRLLKVSSGTQAAAATLPPPRPWEKHLSFMAKELFGTDGIRGTPGIPPLDDATLYATGRSVGGYLKREHGSARVLIGMDTRESGPHIASLLAAGLTQAGATVAFA